MNKDFKQVLNTDETSLGIELGSTRIKTVLIGPNAEVIASGYFDWENQLVDEVWTYKLEDVWSGIQASYASLKQAVLDTYAVKLKYFGAIGVSAMMHGYLAFDSNKELLVPFRTWRNAMTRESEVYLTELLNHNIPQRWSIAHLHQAMLNQESHVKNVDYFTTLAGYVTWQLTGNKNIGIGDASGMFPINSKTLTYDSERVKTFNQEFSKYSLDKDLNDLLPSVLNAGELAGTLLKESVKLIDPSEDLEAGIKLAPAEGDAGTGMVATNAILENTGNISAGTSVFAMIVLDENLSKVYPEIDIVTTPTGSQVAMVHVNNCTSEINSWVNIFREFSQLIDHDISNDELYSKLLKTALSSDDDLKGILSYGYHSGENITKINIGRPLLVRKPDANFSLSNLMRSILDSAFATLSIGLEILRDEGIEIDSIVGHGGIFKTEGVAEVVVAAAVKSPVTLMETANEGGAWGMAILAQYLNFAKDMTLDEYLNSYVFKDAKVRTYNPSEAEINAYAEYVKIYQAGLVIEATANNLV